MLVNRHVTPHAFLVHLTKAQVNHGTGMPVFVDVEPRTHGMDPALLEAAIGPRTRAVMPVHLHGVPCDLQPIADIAARRGLLLIEDSAQAIGARYRGRFAGTLGVAGCYSLQSSKSMACGEGGLLVEVSCDVLWGGGVGDVAEGLDGGVGPGGSLMGEGEGLVIVEGVDDVGKGEGLEREEVFEAVILAVGFGLERTLSPVPFLS